MTTPTWMLLIGSVVAIVIILLATHLFINKMTVGWKPQKKRRVVVDKDCEALDQAVQGVDMEKLAEHMRRTGQREITLTGDVAARFRRA